MVELSGGHTVVGGQQAPTRQGLQGIHHLCGANGRVRDCKYTLCAFALLCGSTASTKQNHPAWAIQIHIFQTRYNPPTVPRISIKGVLTLSVSGFEGSSPCAESGTPRIQPPPSQAVTHAISTLLTRALSTSVSTHLYYLDTYITSTVSVHPTFPPVPGLPTAPSGHERA